MSNERNLVIWLCSSKDEYYKAWIQNIAQKANAPVFSPHITLLGSVKTVDITSYKNAISPIIHHISKTPIQFGNIQMEDFIWRAMYFLIEPKELLTEMHHKLANALSEFGADKDAHYLPHLSLLYTEIPKEEKQVLLNNSRPLSKKEHLLFDQIRIVDFNRTDVEASEELFCFELG